MVPVGSRKEGWYNECMCTRELAASRFTDLQRLVVELDRLLDQLEILVTTWELEVTWRLVGTVSDHSVTCSAVGAVELGMIRGGEAPVCVPI